MGLTEEGDTDLPPQLLQPAGTASEGVRCQKQHRASLHLCILSSTGSKQDSWGSVMQVLDKDAKLQVTVISPVNPPGRTFFREFLILNFFFLYSVSQLRVLKV